MPSILQVVTGKNAGTKFELVKDRIVLGRHPDCEVVVDLSAVSRFHAHMLKQGETYAIEDLKSRNGTFVNGKRVDEPTPLQDNDRVKICDTLFVYRSEKAAGRNPTSDLLNDYISAEESDYNSTVLSAIDADGSREMMVKVHAEAKLKAVLEISQTVGQILELDELFEKFLDSLFSIFTQADRALIILTDGTRLIPRALKERRPSEEAVRFSKTIVNQAMEERQAILSADASSDERFATSQSIADFRIRSIMCAPMVIPDRDPLGVIQLDTQSHHHRFHDEDLQILLAVASQAAIAIDNASLHAKILGQSRLDQELKFARDVQRGFLPKSMPKVPGYEFWAYYEAAGQVGGDYYDFVKLPTGQWAIILGDVSGKGVPAALMMSKASSDTKVGLISHPNELGLAMETINNQICDAGLEDRFITMVIGILDPETHQLTLVNAGHMSPIIRRDNGELEEPASDDMAGLPLGVMEEMPYETVSVTLNLNEPVVLYSDGISEAMNANNEEYTIGRLRSKMKSVDLPPSKLGELLMKDVREHVAGHKQSDDISLVVFGRSDNVEPPTEV